VDHDQALLQQLEQANKNIQEQNAAQQQVVVQHLTATFGQAPDNNVFMLPAPQPAQLFLEQEAEEDDAPMVNDEDLPDEFHDLPRMEGN
jgi:hypothetical protein